MTEHADVVILGMGAGGEELGLRLATGTRALTAGGEQAEHRGRRAPRCGRPYPTFHAGVGKAVGAYARGIGRVLDPSAEPLSLS